MDGNGGDEHRQRQHDPDAGGRRPTGEKPWSSPKPCEPAGTADPLGVKVATVANDPAPFPQVFNPAHPDANARGFLALPNVNPVQEMADLTVASRAYEANAAAFGVAKSMFVKALEVGR